MVSEASNAIKSSSGKSTGDIQKIALGTNSLVGTGSLESKDDGKHDGKTGALALSPESSLIA